MKYKARGPYYRAQTSGAIQAIFGRPKRASKRQRELFAAAVEKVQNRLRKAKI